MPIPRGLVLKDVALAADGGLRLGSRVTIKPGNARPRPSPCRPRANPGRRQEPDRIDCERGSVNLHNHSQVRAR